MDIGRSVPRNSRLLRLPGSSPVWLLLCRRLPRLGCRPARWLLGHRLPRLRRGPTRWLLGGCLPRLLRACSLHISRRRMRLAPWLLGNGTCSACLRGIFSSTRLRSRNALPTWCPPACALPFRRIRTVRGRRPRRCRCGRFGRHVPRSNERVKGNRLRSPTHGRRAGRIRFSACSLEVHPAVRVGFHRLRLNIERFRIFGSKREHHPKRNVSHSEQTRR